MNLPEYITRQQLTAAFNTLGIDHTQVLSWSGDHEQPWLLVQLAGEHPTVEYVAASIPIVEQAPQDAADLVALARQEARG